MGRKKKFTVDQIVDACKGSAGIMAVVAKKLKCDRSTIWSYAKRSKKIQAALLHESESVTDLAESKMLTLIDKEYWPAIRYRLATKGKDRGYTEKTQTEITGKDGGPIETKETGLTDVERLAALDGIFKQLSEKPS